MSLYEHDIYWYGSASMPEDDSSTVGGAVSASTAVSFSDVSPAGLMDYVSSSGSDTAATIVATGRDATGALVTESKTFTGTTLVNGSQSFERLLKGVLGGTTNVGDVAAISHTKVISAHTAQSGAAATSPAAAYIQVQSGDGASIDKGMVIRITNNTPSGAQYQLRRVIRVNGDYVYVNKDWGTAPSAATTYDVHQGFIFDLTPNRITTVRRAFYSAASDVPGGSSKTLYEKVFAVNNNTGTALTNVSITKTLDPSQGTLNISLCKALNDTATAANRVTTPVNGDATSLTFTSGAAPQSQSVVSPGNLPSGSAPNAASAQGVWLQLVLTAGLPAAKLNFTVRASGVST